jgi:dihydrofolate reductase
MRVWSYRRSMDSAWGWVFDDRLAHRPTVDAAQRTIHYGKAREEEPMAKVIAGMATSLDGFVADESGSARLYPDLEELHGTGYMDALIEETGAVLMGRRTFEMAEDPDWYVGNYEFQVPIFVLTHRPPSVSPKQDERLTFTFVTDGVGSAIAKAKAAAAGRAVGAIGASVIQQLLRAGLVDELRVDVMPVLLGAGLRLFDEADPVRAGLEKIAVLEVGPRTSLRFRVKR